MPRREAGALRRRKSASSAKQTIIVQEPLFNGIKAANEPEKTNAEAERQRLWCCSLQLPREGDTPRNP